MVRNYMISKAIAVLALLGSVPAVAETRDSVSMGPQYADQVFYQFGSGEKGRSPNANWHIAFSTTGTSATILTNGAAGVKLQCVPEKTVKEWATIDTTGSGAWPIVHNDAKDWAEGAFSRTRDESDPFDLGWGSYSMMTHTVVGKRVFVITLPDGTVRKIRVDGLVTGVFTVTHAGLDGTDEQTITINRKDYATKNLIYRSLTEHETIDREPVRADWDITFTRYIEPVPYGQVMMDYPVTGILTAPGVKAIKLTGEAALNPVVPVEPAWDSSAMIIGSNWKSFTGGTYVVRDSVAWIIRRASGNIVVFKPTRFSGGGTGTTSFTTEAITTSVTEHENGRTSLALMPSMVDHGGSIRIVTDLPMAVRCSIVDATGREVMNLSIEAGLTSTVLSTSTLANGMYRAIVRNPFGITTQAFIVR